MSGAGTAETVRTGLSAAHAEKSGTVLDVYVGERIQVEAGDSIIKIHPQDNFYVFNQSLAIFSFFACIFFFVFHFFGN